MIALVRTQLDDVRARLLELDMSIEILQAAAKAGHTGRMLCNDFDPPFIFGTEAWRFTVRTLREQLVANGRWRKEDLGNYALVVNDAIKLNIVVATGDAATGREDLTPKTRSPKGLYTEAAIQRNLLRQGDLFPETLPESVVRKAITLAYPTRTFLLHIADGEIRAELSIPEAIEGGEIIRWGERIILPAIKIDSVDIDEADLAPDFDIEVRLKA